MDNFTKKAILFSFLAFVMLGASFVLFRDVADVTPEAITLSIVQGDVLRTENKTIAIDVSISWAPLIRKED